MNIQEILLQAGYGLEYSDASICDYRRYSKIDDESELVETVSTTDGKITDVCFEIHAFDSITEYETIFTTAERN